jgi:hypothetical protein
VGKNGVAGQGTDGNVRGRMRFCVYFAPLTTLMFCVKDLIMRSVGLRN